jgi:hypothetical protein
VLECVNKHTFKISIRLVVLQRPKVNQQAPFLSNSVLEAMESQIDLNVKTIDSMVYALKNVPTQDEVSVLKEKVRDATGIVVDRQRLIYRGRVLEDEQKLSEYEMGDGACIHLVARPENYEALQRSAEANLEQSANETASSRSVAAAMSNLLNTGASFGMGNNTRREPVVDPQEESIEALWQGLVSMHTLLSVGGGRESSSVRSVRGGVLAEMRAAGSAGTSMLTGLEEEDLPEVRRAWGQDDGSMSPPAETPLGVEEEEEEEGEGEGGPSNPHPVNTGSHRHSRDHTAPPRGHEFVRQRRAVLRGTMARRERTRLRSGWRRRSWRLTLRTDECLCTTMAGLCAGMSGLSSTAIA